MRALDTNILVRLLAKDNAEQLALARQLVGEPCFIGPTVLLETVWVLQSGYHYADLEIVERLQPILQIDTVSVFDAQAVSWVLERFERGADFADMMHLVQSGPSSSFATFDRKLAAQAGASPPLPIETLAA